MISPAVVSELVIATGPALGAVPGPGSEVLGLSGAAVAAVGAPVFDLAVAAVAVPPVSLPAAALLLAAAESVSASSLRPFAGGAPS